MENKRDAAASAVYELPGEPAVVINGVPELISDANNNNAIVPFRNEETTTAEKQHSDSGLGEWFLGREIGKWFKGKYYSGKVSEYDEETGWYRIIYDDGDSEDLDWKELEELLLPLDVTTSLRTLTHRMIVNKNSNKKTTTLLRKSGPQIKRCRTTEGK